MGGTKLGLLDFGARLQDGRTGRWGAIDPLAEAYCNISPYAYCAGNPIGARDENGEWVNIVVGAVVGVVADYAIQVSTNYIEGKSGLDAWV